MGKSDMNKLIAWWRDWRDWRQACREYAYMHEPRKVFERYHELRAIRVVEGGDDAA